MSKAVLKITDGTPANTINLLGRRKGYLLCDWRPARPELRYIINENWFTGTETPASVLIKSTIDTFTFTNRSSNVDGLVEAEQDFSRIIKESAMYWAGNKAIKNPYYIVAKSKDETNLRYATIFSAQLHDSSNPYKSPFFTNKPMDSDLIVPITHGAWLDYPPNGNGLVMYDNVISMLSSSITGINQGIRFLGSDSKILMPNMISHIGVTHIFKGSEVENMLDGQPLYQIITDINYEYTNIRISPTVNYNFLTGVYGIHFNITTPASTPGLDSPEFTWEMFTTSGWVVIETLDLTESLTIPGVVLFNFDDQPMVLTTINGVNGFWIRFKQSALLNQRPWISIVHPTIPALSYFDILLHGDDYNPPSSGYIEVELEGEIDGELDDLITYEASHVDMGSYYIVTFRNNSLSYGYILEWFVTDPTGYQHSAIGDSIDVYFVPTGPFPWTVGTYSLEVGYPNKTPSVYVESEWTITDPEFRVTPDFNINIRVGAIGAWFQFNSGISMIYLGDYIIDHIEWILEPGMTPLVGDVANYQYQTPGIYDVQMTIYFSKDSVVDKSATVTKRRAVRVIDNVYAKFNADTRRGEAPLKIEFDASETTTENSSIVSYAWDFGDGTVGSGIIVEKEYDHSGIYTVFMKATDNLGYHNTATYINYVYVDSRLLYPGDSGINLEFSIKPVKLPWATDLTAINSSKMYIGAKSLINPSDGLFQGFLPTYKGQFGDNASGVLYIGKYWSRTYHNESAYTGFVYHKVNEAIPDNLGDANSFVTLRFGKDVANIYNGTYRLFLRMSCSLGAANGDFFFFANVSTESISDDNAQLYGGNKTRDVTDIFSPSYITTLDIGSITLGGKSGISQDLNIFWRSLVPIPTFPDPNYAFSLYDVVLIPQDEWFAEITFPADNTSGVREIIISSLTPSGDVEAIVKDGDGIPRYIPSIIPGLPLSTIGKDVRFTVLSTIHDRRNSDAVKFIPIQYSRFDTFHEISNVTKVNKYFGSRGSR